MVSEEDIKKIADSFRTFDQIYEKLEMNEFKSGSVIEMDITDGSYPIIDWMIEAFTEEEKYERCQILKDLRDKLDKNKTERLLKFWKENSSKCPEWLKNSGLVDGLINNEK